MHVCVFVLVRVCDYLQVHIYICDACVCVCVCVCKQASEQFLMLFLRFCPHFFFTMYLTGLNFVKHMVLVS